MSKNLSPARLNITDLPRDPQRCLGPLRQTLVASVNYCKKHPKKLEIIMDVLRYAYVFCKKTQETQKAAKKLADKVKSEAEAIALDINEQATEVELALLALKKMQDAELSAKSE